MNKISEIELFEILKKELTRQFLKANSASSIDISEWKGQDIVDFQEDVFSRTKSTVSEKWFYTYFKSEFKKLPRIDMLNLLSQYAGYTGWSEFIQTHQNNLEEAIQRENQEKKTQAVVLTETPPAEKEKVLKVENTEEKITEISPARPAEKPKKKRNYLFIGFISILGLGILLTSAFFIFFYQKTFEFCFMDSDRNSTITEPIEITIARKGFTPLELFTVNGCIEFPSKEDTLLMVIKSTYYKQDTFKINLHQYQGRETIRLQPDDYKVMLRHYSKSSQSVKERIKMLDQMIADDALIYQVYDNEYFGVEVLSKKQYINLVSLPTTSLKNYTLIEAERKNGKIVKIKFKIQSDET